MRALPYLLPALLFLLACDVGEPTIPAPSGEGGASASSASVASSSTGPASGGSTVLCGEQADVANCPELEQWAFSPTTPCALLKIQACALSYDVEVPANCIEVAPCGGGKARVACCDVPAASFYAACHADTPGEGCAAYDCLVATCGSGDRCSYAPGPDGANCLLSDGAAGSCAKGLCVPL